MLLDEESFTRGGSIAIEDRARPAMLAAPRDIIRQT
jgi:hypothetical protein